MPRHSLPGRTRRRPRTPDSRNTGRRHRTARPGPIRRRRRRHNREIPGPGDFGLRARPRHSRPEDGAHSGTHPDDEGAYSDAHADDDKGAHEDTQPHEAGSARQDTHMGARRGGRAAWSSIPVLLVPWNPSLGAPSKPGRAAGVRARRGTCSPPGTTEIPDVAVLVVPMAEDPQRGCCPSLSAPRQRLYLDVGMLTSERPQVVSVAGRDDATAEADRGRDDQGIHGVTGVQPIAVPQACRAAACPIVIRRRPCARTRSSAVSAGMPRYAAVCRG